MTKPKKSSSPVLFPQPHLLTSPSVILLAAESVSRVSPAFRASFRPFSLPSEVGFFPHGDRLLSVQFLIWPSQLSSARSMLAPVLIERWIIKIYSNRKRMKFSLVGSINPPNLSSLCSLISWRLQRWYSRLRSLSAAANSGFRRRSALHFPHLDFLPKLHPALAFFGMITALDAIRVFSLALIKLICQSRQTRHVKSVKFNCFYFDVMLLTRLNARARENTNCNTGVVTTSR